MKDRSDTLVAALNMRATIGGMRAGGVKLTQEQINHYLLVRLVDLEEDHFKMIGALQSLGVDFCEWCDTWKKNTLCIADKCQCLDCCASYPEALLCDGFVDDYEGAKVKIVDFLTRHGRRTKFSGELLETYRKIAQRA